MRTIKLNQKVIDSATLNVGTLTGLYIDTNRSCSYLFQPHGLNKEDGQPLKAIFYPAARFIAGKTPIEYEELDVPLSMLGSDVEDVPTGFKGTAINLIYHLSGCVHVDVQPVGSDKKGEMLSPCNFDIRRLKGKMVPKLSEADFDRSKKEKPGGPSLPGLQFPSTKR